MEIQPAQLARVAKALGYAQTLTDAEGRLWAILGKKATKSLVWGLWDGYRNLPPETNGLHKGLKMAPPEVVEDYTAGWELGWKMKEGKDA